MVPDDVEKAMTALGLEVIKVDEQEVTARCPGHVWRLDKADRNPSWSVNRFTGIHYCFSCGYKGTFLELVMDVLANRENGSDVYRASRFILAQGLRQESVELKEYTLAKGNPPPESKPLPEARLWDFADVPDRELRKRKITREAADDLCLRWSMADGAWVLPLRLPSGALIGWQIKKGRFVRNHPEGVKRAHTFFGIELFEEGGVPIIVESQLDVARLRSIGIKNGLAIMGSHISAEQARLLVHIADEAIVAVDNPNIDAAGAKEIDRLINGKYDKWGNKIEEPLLSRLPLRFLSYESGAKDVGEMDDDEALDAVTNATGPLEALCKSTTLLPPLR